MSAKAHALTVPLVFLRSCDKINAERCCSGDISACHIPPSSSSSKISCPLRVAAPIFSTALALLDPITSARVLYTSMLTSNRGHRHKSAIQAVVSVFSSFDSFGGSSKRGSSRYASWSHSKPMHLALATMTSSSKEERESRSDVSAERSQPIALQRCKCIDIGLRDDHGICVELATTRRVHDSHISDRKMFTFSITAVYARGRSGRRRYRCCRRRASRPAHLDSGLEKHIGERAKGSRGDAKHAGSDRNIKLIFVFHRRIDAADSPPTARRPLLVEGDAADDGKDSASHAAPSLPAVDPRIDDDHRACTHAQTSFQVSLARMIAFLQTLEGTSTALMPDGSLDLSRSRSELPVLFPAARRTTMDGHVAYSRTRAQGVFADCLIASLGKCTELLLPPGARP